MSSVVVLATVKVDASAFSEVAAVAAVRAHRNLVRFSLFRVPLYARSDTCVRWRRILSLFDRRQYTDCEACQTTADSDWFLLRRRRVFVSVYILCRIRQPKPTSWRLALF